MSILLKYQKSTVICSIENDFSHNFMLYFGVKEREINQR